MQLTDRQTQVLATIATITAVSMYVSYIPQIQMNLAGQKGSALQPLVAAINCTLWVIYALFKPQRDIPVALANAPGIVLGLIATITAIGMYVAYLPQIQMNLAGQKGTPIQPAVACVNGLLWVIYALFKKGRDWPVTISNAPGFILGGITFLTAIL